MNNGAGQTCIDKPSIRQLDKRMCKTLSLLLALAMAGLCIASPPEDPRPELGSVKWQRDFEAAKKSSQASGKPLLLLFQEVPG